MPRPRLPLCLTVVLALATQTAHSTLYEFSAQAPGTITVNGVSTAFDSLTIAGIGDPGNSSGRMAPGSVEESVPFTSLAVFAKDAAWQSSGPSGQITHQSGQCCTFLQLPGARANGPGMTGFFWGEATAAGWTPAADPPSFSRAFVAGDQGNGYLSLRLSFTSTGGDSVSVLFRETGMLQSPTPDQLVLSWRPLGAVPEPGTLALAGLSLLGIGVRRRIQKP